ILHSSPSQHLRRERDDPHEPLLAQFPAHGPEDAGAARVPAIPDQDGGVLVEADVRAVAAAPLLAGAHHDGLNHIALLDARPGQGVLDGGHYDAADARIPPARPAEHTDAQELLGTCVVGDLEPRLLLDHFAFSTILATRQRLVAESGLVSARTTRSPTPQAFCSSCATYFLVRRMTLPYFGCLTRSSTITMTVLSILSLTTRPSLTLRWPRTWTGAAASCVASLIGCSLLLKRYDAEFTLPLDRVDPRDLLPHGPEPTVALKLAGRRLETQVEQLDLRFGQLVVQFL